MNVRDKLDLLPLRQMVSTVGSAASIFARREPLDWLSRPERYQIHSHGSGGQLLAANEPALGEAQAVLRQAYGSNVIFGAASVHSYVDWRRECLMVPIIYLRIDAPRCHAEALRKDLAERSANLLEADLQRVRVVLRAEMELALALGLTRHIHDLTGGCAHILSWLVRYDRASAGAQDFLKENPHEPQFSGTRAPEAHPGDA